MLPIRTLHIVLWVLYALVAVAHVLALLTDVGPLQDVSQIVFAPILLALLWTAAPGRSRLTDLMTVGLVFAWIGDCFGQLLPQAAQLIATSGFLVALVCYTTALVPLWRASQDPLRFALAIPYGAVVVGLFIACADGTGAMLPVVACYAVALGVMAFLAAGVNGLTWVGGTLFLLSSSLLAMEWFLPGAAIAYGSVWIMLAYVLGHALFVAGMIQALPSRRWTPVPLGGAVLVTVES